MEGRRGTWFGLSLTAVLAACTLIDPLDDISGGAPKGDEGSGEKNDASGSSGSASSSSSGGAGDDDDDASTSSSSSSGSSSSGDVTILCTGPDEQEPNEMIPSPLSSPQSCGVLTKGSADVDLWAFKNDTTETVQVTLRVDGPAPIMLKVSAGSNLIISNSGSSKLTKLDAGEVLVMELKASNTTTEDIPYRILFVAK